MSRKSLGVPLASWVSRDFLSSDSQFRADAVSSVEYGCSLGKYPEAWEVEEKYLELASLVN